MLNYFKLELCEYFDNVLSEKIEEDPELAKASLTEKELAKKLMEDQAHDSLPAQYTDAMIFKTALEMEIIYLQGWKDCTELMHKLNLLSL